MSQDPHSRPGGGYARQAPGGSSSDESGAAAAAAPVARGRTLPAQRRAASAWTGRRGATDQEHLGRPPRPPPRPPTDRANESDKENQHRNGIVPARRLNRPAGLPYPGEDPQRPIYPDTRGAAIGQAEAAGQRGRGGGPANQVRWRLAPTRPTAQAADDISGASTGLGVGVGSRRAGRGQRTETDENAVQEIPMPVEALVARLNAMGNVVTHANKHAENAADVSNKAMAHNKVLLEELGSVQRTEPDRIDPATLAIEHRALLETGRAKRQSDRATAEAERATSKFWQAANTVQQAQHETMHMGEGQLVTRAAPSLAPIIAEVRAASIQVDAHEAAARAAAGEAQQAAQAAEALMEQLRRILARQIGGPPIQGVR